MRTPFGSVATADRFHPSDQSISANSNASSSRTKMHGTIYHPNAAPGRYSSTAGMDGHSQQMEGEECERRRAEERAEGRRSRRASVDASPTAKRQRFEIIRKLGSGTYGKVSLALDHRTGEEVAVKVIKKSAIENTADLIRIRREIRIMSALKHPNIIEIKEVFENNEKIILVMEYASGGELYDYVSSHGPLDEQEVRRLFRQITSAVFYCHKHGVAHRDLKLENILLDRGMDAKIADFGLSNYFKPSSLLHTFCGSPLYASPEIINGTPYKGPEVDCWSLGVLLYTLAYSSMPFDGRDFNRMIRQIKRGAYYEPDPPSSASMLIRSMLRVNPDRRADIDQIAGHWWLNYDENAPSIAELQENQVLDSTPLYIRQETLMIQSLGEENEVFAEYTQLSDATRKKIEEFRRRKKEADWFLTDSQSPIKKQSKKRSSSVISDKKRQSSQHVNQKQGSQAMIAAGMTKKQSSHTLIKQQQQSGAAPVFAAPGAKKSAPTDYQATPVPSAASITPAPASPRRPVMDQQPTPMPSSATITQQATPAPSMSNLAESETLQWPEDDFSQISDSMYETNELPEEIEEEAPPMPEEPMPTPLKNIPRPSTMVLLNEALRPQRSPTVHHSPKPEPAVVAASAASVDTAIIEEANRLINQLMEEALKGPVSYEIVDNIRSSDAYEKEQFVKEILDSVLVAQQPKPIPLPSRSRSKHSSMSRMPMSASASASSTPLPDLDVADRLSMGGAVTPPPTEVSPAYYDDFIAPTAQLTITLPHHNVIHQTVPEEAELELSGSGIEMERARRRPPILSESEEEEEDEEEEEEEDVYSTDFEDMTEPSSESEEDVESIGSVKDETDIEPVSDINPISTVDSCASLDEGPSPEVRPVFTPKLIEGALIVQIPDESAIPDEESVQPLPPPAPPVFRRRLSKRISRGKYERSKFTFGRDISIEDSPRSSRRRIGGVQPEPKDAPKLFQKAKQYILQYPDPERSSPERAPEGRRRRYSDGDKKKEKNQNEVAAQTATAAKRDEWNKSPVKTDPKASPGSKFNKPIINCECADEPDYDYDQDAAVAYSVQRRQERARERESIMGDYCPVNGYYHDAPPDDRPFSPTQTTHAKKRTYVTAGEAKSVGAIEPQTLQVAPKTRRSSAEPLLDILEAGGGQADEYDGGTASYGMPRTPTLARPPSNSALNAEIRRHSYRSAMEDSLNSSQEGDRASTGSNTAAAAVTAMSLPPVSPPPFDPPPTPRARYASPALTTTPGEPYWLQQYNREDTHRHQTPTSHYGYTGDHGDRSRLMSPIASGGGKREGSIKIGAKLKADVYWRSQVPTPPLHQTYAEKRSLAKTMGSLFTKNYLRYERTDEDYYAVRAYGYRSSSVFTTTTPHSREMSPAQGRSFMSPIRTTHLDSEYGYARRQKAKSWYTSGDIVGGSFEDTLSSTSRYKPGLPGPPRFESVTTTSRRSNGSTGVGNYFRSFFDVAYNRTPRTPDYRQEREKTPNQGQFGTFLQHQSSLKRRSRSLDKSLHGNKTLDRKPPVSVKNVGTYMPDDRVDVSAHTSTYHNHDSSMGMNMENVGGAGRFGSLLLNTGSSRYPPETASDKTPVKGILKKQSPVIGYGRYPEAESKKGPSVEFGPNRRMNFIDRIRRHLSTEKLPTRSPEPSDFKQRASRAESTSPDSSKQSKKRSILQLARRRPESRPGNGNESGYGSGSVSSDEYTSHTSTTPIEKIKGFFGGKGGRESTPTSHYPPPYQQGPSREGGSSGAAYVAAYRKAYQTTHRAYTPTARY